MDASLKKDDLGKNPKCQDDITNVFDDVSK